VISPRVAPGLLTWQAWRHLRAADAVLGADVDPQWLAVLDEAGVSAPADLADVDTARRAGTLLEAAAPGRVAVWLGSADGDPGLTDALAEHLSRRAVTGRPPEVELVSGSHDVPGARLLDLVAVMDRLRSPGGCPWDAEQTHASLLPYLLEEAHEVIEAVENLDRGSLGEDSAEQRAHLREELGDLLLQVVFHARMAQDDEQHPFDVDDVAAGIVDKLVRRHPHVFAGLKVQGAAEVHTNWEQIKAAEKRREGVFDGIPSTLPSLARAQKMLARLERAGVPSVAAAVAAAAEQDGVGGTLLATVDTARRQGVDAEAALRSILTRLGARLEDGPRPADP